MSDELPRQLPERTGKHRCAKCLRETADEEYFGFDHYCRQCAENDRAFPLASTPEPEADQPSGGEKR